MRHHRGMRIERRRDATLCRQDGGAPITRFQGSVVQGPPTRRPARSERGYWRNYGCRRRYTRLGLSCGEASDQFTAWRKGRRIKLAGFLLLAVKEAGAQVSLAGVG